MTTAWAAMAHQLACPEASARIAAHLERQPLQRRAYLRRLPDWLPCERDQVHALHARGVSVKNIAAEVDLAPATVREILEGTPSTNLSEGRTDA